MKNKKHAIVVISGIFLCLIIGYLITRPEILSAWAQDVRIDENRRYRVMYLIDGDTLAAEVSGRVIRVRMLGINTPETVDPRWPVECYGPEASAETKLLLDKRYVRFTVNPNRELKDKYGRYLLYVYRDDGLFVNEYLIKNGFAREYTFGKPYSMQAEFRMIEREARTSTKGLWAKCKQS